MRAYSIERIQSSYALFSAQPARAALVYYRELFQLEPRLRVRLRGDVEHQGEALMQLLDTLIAALPRVEHCTRLLEALGRRHLGHSIEEQQLDTLAFAMIRALELELGERFDKDTRYAWIDAYRQAAALMRRAASPQAAAA